MSYYEVKITDGSGNNYYVDFCRLEYGREIGDPGRFMVEIKGAIPAESTAFGKGYTVQISRDGTVEFKGIVDNRRYRGKNLILEGLDYNTIKLTKYIINNRKIVSWNNNDILKGKTDQALTQFSASAKVALISSSASDTQLATVCGFISNAEYKIEKIQLNGTTEVLTTNTFSEVWFVELESAATGTVSVKQGTGGTVRASITDSITAVVDSNGHYGNGLLHDSGVDDGTITAYSGNPISIDFNGITPFKAIQELCEMCIDSGTLKPQEFEMDYSAGNKLNISDGLGTDKSSTVILTSGTDCKLTDRREDTSSIINFVVVESRIDGTGEVIRKSASDAASISTYGKRCPPRIPLFFNKDATTLQKIANRIVEEGKDAGDDVSLDDITTDNNIILGDTIKIIDVDTNFNSNLRVKSLMVVVSGENDKFKINVFPTGTEIMDRVNNLKNLSKKLSNSSDFGVVDNVNRKDIQTQNYVNIGECDYNDSLDIYFKFPDDLNSWDDIISCKAHISRDNLRFLNDGETEILDADRTTDLDMYNTHLFPSPDDLSWITHTDLDHAVSGSYEYEGHDVYYALSLEYDGTGAGWVGTPHCFVRVKNKTDTEYYPYSNGITSLISVDESVAGARYNVQGLIHIPKNLKGKTITLEIYNYSTRCDEILAVAEYVDIRGHKHDITPEIKQVGGSSKTFNHEVDGVSSGSVSLAPGYTSSDIDMLPYLKNGGYPPDDWREHTFSAETSTTDTARLIFNIKLRYYANND